MDYDIRVEEELRLWVTQLKWLYKALPRLGLLNCLSLGSKWFV